MREVEQNYAMSRMRENTNCSFFNSFLNQRCRRRWRVKWGSRSDFGYIFAPHFSHLTARNDVLSIEMTFGLSRGFGRILFSSRVNGEKATSMPVRPTTTSK